MISLRLKLTEAAPLLDVSADYLRDVLQDFSRSKKNRRYAERVHARLLSEFFFKDELNGRWYIARTTLERVVKERNAAVLFRDPQRAAENRKRLEQLL
jgi:1-acyl-sn-glycerol-3-phosphate acyltransferase